MAAGAGVGSIPSRYRGGVSLSSLAPSRREGAIDGGVAAIILAGGSSTRLGTGANKVLATIGGRTVLSLSLETCAAIPAVALVVVVTREGERSVVQELAAAAGIAAPVMLATGGASRHQSEVAGLDVVRPAVAAGEIDVVTIHDGARPFATAALHTEVIEAARTVGGGVPGVTSIEPMFLAGATGLERIGGGEVVAVQTPQAFRAVPLLEAYERAGQAGFEGVDTADTVALFGDVAVALVAGDRRNLKITFDADLDAAGALIPAWAAGRWMR